MSDKNNASAGFDELFEKAEPSKEFFSHMEIADLLGFPQNEMRMRASVDPHDIETLADRLLVDGTKELIYYAEILARVFPLLPPASPVVHWVHYRQSVV